RWLGREPGPVVQNGIELGRFSGDRSSRLRVQLGTTLPLVLSIGRFEEQQDHLTGVQAMRHLPEAGVVLGGYGSWMEHWTARTRRWPPTRGSNPPCSFEWGSARGVVGSKPSSGKSLRHRDDRRLLLPSIPPALRPHRGTGNPLRSAGMKLVHVTAVPETLRFF